MKNTTAKLKCIGLILSAKPGQINRTISEISSLLNEPICGCDYPAECNMQSKDRRRCINNSIPCSYRKNKIKGETKK